MTKWLITAYFHCQGIHRIWKNLPTYIDSSINQRKIDWAYFKPNTNITYECTVPSDSSKSNAKNAIFKSR